MYVPARFAVADPALVEQFIVQHSFATLVSIDGHMPVGSHVPVELQVNVHGTKVLRGHLSKANPQWQAFGENSQALAIFLSPVHAYISPSWYEQPNVPTWNYMSVHVTGRVRLLAGDELRRSVSELTDKYEQGRERPVSLDALPPEMQQQLNGIVGFELSMDKVEAAFKLSQNRNDADHASIIAGLKQQGDPLSLGMARQLELQRPTE